MDIHITFISPFYKSYSPSHTHSCWAYVSALFNIYMNVLGSKWGSLSDTLVCIQYESIKNEPHHWQISDSALRSVVSLSMWFFLERSAILWQLEDTTNVKLFEAEGKLGCSTLGMPSLLSLPSFFNWRRWLTSFFCSPYTSIQLLYICY